LTPSGIIHCCTAEEPATRRTHNAGRPTRHAAAALPDRILDAAQTLFLTHGFEATSLNQIALAAGATKRTLYVKIGDKSDIFAAAVRRMLDQRRERLDDPGAALPIADRLIRFCDSLLAVALDPDVLRLCRILVAEAPRFPMLASLMDEQMNHGALLRLENLLRDEVARGRISVANPKLAADLLLTAVVGSAQRAVLFGLEPWRVHRRNHWVRAAIDQFLQGCLPIPRVITAAGKQETR
jgi:TetR/AcrR family transcriptional regulator, mexJK operon transcriptional repressor